MSICSTHSSRVAPGRAAVAANGYRFTTTRSNGNDAVFVDRVHVVVAITNRQNATKDFRMQRLDATVQHLGKAGVVGDVQHLDSRLFQVPSRATGAVDRDTGTLQSGGQIGQAKFVTDADQGIANRDDVRHGDRGFTSAESTTRRPNGTRFRIPAE